MSWYGFLANAVVVVHFGFVLFVVAGGLLVLARPRFAWVHLPALVWGVLIEINGWICPLTPLENKLRVLGEQAGYDDGFVAHYVIPLLYPPGLTASDQRLLALALIATNTAIYGVVLARVFLSRRRRGGRTDSRI